MKNNFKIEVIKKGDKDFPIQLYDLNKCPNKLYFTGNKNLLNEFSIAIVGARKCSEGSKELADKLSYNLSKHGINIVSGLARGIDKVAHESCLKANGKTIAVLGGGFNYLYPKENVNLFYDILEKDGLVITEYEENMPCLAHNFLERNRIIAALSCGIIVVEAKEKSGSLTTAKCGFEIKRKIFTFPGSLSDSSYLGSNRLLVNGAKCILDYHDVLNEYPEFEIKVEEIECIEIKKEYSDIYECLKKGEKNINDLSKELKVSMNVISSKLTFMEIEGYVKRLSGNIFKIC